MPPFIGPSTIRRVEVDVKIDAEPRVVVELADFARVLDADPVARAAYDRLAYSHKRRHVHAIESATKPETRTRRIEKPWQCCGSRNRQRAGPAAPRPSQRGRSGPAPKCSASLARR